MKYVGYAFTFALTLFVLAGITSLIMIHQHIGIPKDTEIARIIFDTKSITGQDCFGYDPEIVSDKFGNQMIRVRDIYEAGWFGWHKTAEIKSFYFEGTPVFKLANP